MIRKAPRTKYPADDEIVVGGAKTRTKVSTNAKKATTHGQTCCKSMGGDIWLRLRESYAARADADKKR